jgi:hypothetical protein
MKITAQALFACDECGLLGEQEIAVPGAISPGGLLGLMCPPIHREERHLFNG